MEDHFHKEPGMSSRATYQITVKGRLPEHWRQWFTGITVRVEYGPEGYPCTIMTCLVKDQPELFGILNRLNNLNLPLREVILLN